jgi:hypothetical protein
MKITTCEPDLSGVKKDYVFWVKHEWCKVRTMLFGTSLNGIGLRPHQNDVKVCFKKNPTPSLSFSFLN